MAKDNSDLRVDLNGRVVLVTGANTGIGYEAALELARMGARVMIHGRSQGKVDTAVAAIREASGNSAVEGLVADFSSLDEVRRLAAEVKARTDRLDVLLNNAGVILDRRQDTSDGFETTFAVNHLAPFVLTDALRDLLVSSAPARVVTVSSGWHTAVKGLDFEDLQHARGYDGKVVYQRSKLANILFTRALARRLEGTGVTANCLHPGVVRTRFGQDGDMGGALAIFFGLVRPFLLSPAAGARTSIYLASSPEVAGVTGQYFAKCKAVDPSRAGQDAAAAERLWQVSEGLVAGRGAATGGQVAA